MKADAPVPPAGELSETLSDLEYAMLVAINGFWQWVVCCGEAAGARNLGPLDMLVLHAINHRARGKKLSDICLVMNVEESHTVAYALKKLEDAGYATHAQAGRDRIYSASKAGDEICRKYREVRKASLVANLAADRLDPDELAQTARALKRMTRYYADASRAAMIASASAER